MSDGAGSSFVVCSSASYSHASVNEIAPAAFTEKCPLCNGASYKFILRSNRKAETAMSKSHLSYYFSSRNV